MIELVKSSLIFVYLDYDIHEAYIWSSDWSDDAEPKCGPKIAYYYGKMQIICTFHYNQSMRNLKLTLFIMWNSRNCVCGDRKYNWPGPILQLFWVNRKIEI